MKTPVANIKSLFDAVNQRNIALIAEFDNLQEVHLQIYESVDISRLIDVYVGKVRVLNTTNIPMYVNQLNEINTVLEALIRYSGAWIGVEVAA